MFGEPKEGTIEYTKFEPYFDIDPPDSLNWVYHQFINLYNACETVITPTTVLDFERLFQIKFTLYENELLFRMKGWACDEKEKLENPEKEVSDE